MFDIPMTDEEVHASKRRGLAMIDDRMYFRFPIAVRDRAERYGLEAAAVYAHKLLCRAAQGRYSLSDARYYVRSITKEKPAVA